ncbi:MAG: zinc ribbon domain-containing protein [Methanoregula sp.]
MDLPKDIDAAQLALKPDEEVILWTFGAFSPPVGGWGGLWSFFVLTSLRVVIFYPKSLPFLSSPIYDQVWEVGLEKITKLIHKESPLLENPGVIINDIKFHSMGKGLKDNPRFSNVRGVGDIAIIFTQITEQIQQMRARESAKKQPVSQPAPQGSSIIFQPVIQNVSNVRQSPQIHYTPTENTRIGRVGDDIIEIKDSVLTRSDIGTKSGGRDPQPFEICPYCGKELHLPKTPKFCPYCREPLSAP